MGLEIVMGTALVDPVILVQGGLVFIFDASGATRMMFS